MSITNNRLLRNWLRAHGVTISHYWVLGELRLQSLHNSSIVQKAVETSWVWGRDLEIDEQDAVDAISDLMANRLIQEVTPANLENIARTLESPRGVIAPRDLLLPELGEITFTLKGARIIIALYEEVFLKTPSSNYLDDFQPDGSGHIYANSREQIAHGLLDHRKEIISFANVGELYSIGPWRSDWWYLNLHGWAVEIQAGNRGIGGITEPENGTLKSPVKIGKE